MRLPAAPCGTAPAFARSLPPLLLLLALSTVFLFGGERSQFYRDGPHDWQSSKNMALAENLSPEHGFKLFMRLEPREDGASGYAMYSRFPLGGYTLVKLVALPFGSGNELLSRASGLLADRRG